MNLDEQRTPTYQAAIGICDSGRISLRLRIPDITSACSGITRMLETLPFVYRQTKSNVWMRPG
jgi:hypothetical protein